jgi:DNA polymerase
MSEYDELVHQIQHCTLCSLSGKRTKAVPGEGDLAADFLFIGEGPGFNEDQQGRPFVGPAGRLLEELLASIGMKREDVYITNMVKCRPPNNREPLPGEIEACKPYLDRLIELIGPKVVVTLGSYSLARFFPGEPIGKARGRPRRWNGILIYPVYHPAAALRNGSLRSALESDFSRLPSILQDPGIDPDGPPRVKTEQLSFF